MSEIPLFPSHLLLSPGWMERVQQALATLQRGVGGECALLADGRGEVIAQTGIADEIVTEELLPLLLEETTLTHRLGRHIGNGTGISVHHYEGDRHQIYVGVAAHNSLLLIVVSHQPSPRRLGVVWLFLRRTLQELNRLIPSPEETSAQSIKKTNPLTPEQARALGVWRDE